MSASAAREFVRRTAEDAELRGRIAALGDEARLDDLVALAAGMGLVTDAVSLRAAWRQAWALRWLAASAKGSPAGNLASSARASPE